MVVADVIYNKTGCTNLPLVCLTTDAPTTHDGSSSVKVALKLGLQCLTDSLNGIVDSSNASSLSSLPEGEYWIEDKLCRGNKSLLDDIQTETNKYLRNIKGTESTSLSSNQRQADCKVREQLGGRLLHMCKKSTYANALQMFATQKLAMVAKQIPKEIFASKQADTLNEAAAHLATHTCSRKSAEYLSSHDKVLWAIQTLSESPLSSDLFLFSRGRDVSDEHTHTVEALESLRGEVSDLENKKREVEARCSLLEEQKTAEQTSLEAALSLQKIIERNTASSEMRLESLETKKLEKESELRRLEEDLCAQKRLFEKEQMCKNLEQKCTDLVGNIEEGNKRLERLQRDEEGRLKVIDELRVQLADLRSQVEALQETENALNNQKKQAEDDIRQEKVKADEASLAQKEEMTRHQVEADQLRCQLKAKTAQLKSLEARVLLAERIEVLGKQKLALVSANQKSSAELGEWRAKISTSEGAKNVLENETRILKEESKTGSLELRDLQSKIDGGNLEVSVKKSTSDELVAEISEVQANSKMVSELSAELDRKQGMVMETQGKITTTRAEIQKLNDELQRVQLMTKAKEKDYNFQKQLIIAQQKAREAEWKQICIDLTKKSETLEKLEKNVKYQRQSWSGQDRQNLTQEVGNITGEVSRTEQTLKTLRAEVAQLKSEIPTLTSQITQLENEKNRVDKLINTLQTTTR